MLYCLKDHEDAKCAKKTLWLQLILAAVLFVAVIVMCSVIRYPWPGYVTAVLWAVFTVFLWDLKGSRIYKYCRFLDDINQSSVKNITGALMSVNSDISIKDTLDFYVVEFCEDGAEKDCPARKLYIDASKEFADVEPGTRLTLGLFGNYIISIELIK